jgi:hypothetical protein
MRRGLALALLLVLEPMIARAGSATVQRPTPDLVGARALAMGDAYVAAPAGGPGYFHNPAALGLLPDVRLFAQTNVTNRDAVEMDPKGIAYGWRRWGAAWGNRIAEDDEGVADYTYVSGGVSLSSHVALGMSAKVWRSHPWPRFQALGGSATYDIGALVDGPAGWTVGGRIGQLSRGERPRAGAVGAWWERGAHAFAAEIEASDGQPARLSAGAEWEAARHIRLRVGARGTEPTAGVGFAVGPSAVDVAWTQYNGAGVLVVSIASSLRP